MHKISAFHHEFDFLGKIFKYSKMLVMHFIAANHYHFTYSGKGYTGQKLKMENRVKTSKLIQVTKKN